jgi:hypothetical protein
MKPLVTPFPDTLLDSTIKAIGTTEKNIALMEFQLQ